MHESGQGDGARGRRLGELLVEAGRLSEEALAQALAKQQETGLPLGRILVEGGYVTKHAVAMALADQGGGPLKTEYGFAVGRAPDAASPPAGQIGQPEISIPLLRLPSDPVPDVPPPAAAEPETPAALEPPEATEPPEPAMPVQPPPPDSELPPLRLAVPADEPPPELRLALPEDEEAPAPFELSEPEPEAPPEPSPAAEAPPEPPQPTEEVTSSPEPPAYEIAPEPDYTVELDEARLARLAAEQALAATRDELAAAESARARAEADIADLRTHLDELQDAATEGGPAFESQVHELVSVVERQTEALAAADAAAAEHERERDASREELAAAERGRQEAETAVAELRARVEELEAATAERSETAPAQEQLDELLALVERQAADLAAADAAAAEHERERSEAAVGARSYASDRHVLFVPSNEGYRIVERSGPAPTADSLVELSDEGTFRVLRLGPAPFPGATEACAYLEGVEDLEPVVAG